MEKVTRGAVTEWKHYIPAGAGTMALQVRKSAGSPASATYYVTGDHLGSATAVMASDGTLLSQLSFAAFGTRRGSAWQDQPLAAEWTTITATTRRGFTGHEHLDNLSLVHMNGRVYDPQLGRFLSADPVYGGDLAQPQSLDPYGYVMNNPLSYADPSGYSASSVAADGFFASTVDLIANGALLDLQVAIDNYRRDFGNWLAGCRAALAYCNGGDVPIPTGVADAGKAAVRASTALMQMINQELSAREQQRDVALAVGRAEWAIAGALDQDPGKFSSSLVETLDKLMDSVDSITGGRPISVAMAEGISSALEANLSFVLDLYASRYMKAVNAELRAIQDNFVGLKDVNGFANVTIRGVIGFDLGTAVRYIPRNIAVTGYTLDIRGWPYPNWIEQPPVGHYAATFDVWLTNAGVPFPIGPATPVFNVTMRPRLAVLP